MNTTRDPVNTTPGRNNAVRAVLSLVELDRCAGVGVEKFDNRGVARRDELRVQLIAIVQGGRHIPEEATAWKAQHLESPLPAHGKCFLAGRGNFGLSHDLELIYFENRPLGEIVISRSRLSLVVICY